MQPELTRHDSVDLQTTSSLSSTPPPAATAEDGPSDQRPRRTEQPGSPAFSTTSTADEGGSSPVLPPLPTPTINGRTIDLLRTPPSGSGSRSDTSHYYTASWGSPYQQPASSIRGHTHAHSLALSSDTSEDSPIRHLEFHTPFLRPAPNFIPLSTDADFVSHDGLVSAAVLANRARRPATGLTEDWIRQHTGGESAEKNHWLSDGPGDSEHSSLSGSISGDGGDWLLGQEYEPRTPTLNRFWESRLKTRPGHKRGPSTETLRQADFSDSLRPTMSSVNESVESVEVDTQTPSPADERPPPPPKDTTWRAAALPAPVEAHPCSDPNSGTTTSQEEDSVERQEYYGSFTLG